MKKGLIKKKGLLALLVVALLLAVFIPTAAMADNESNFNAFFTNITTNDIATITNDATYPFTVDDETADGPWLKSGNTGQKNSKSIITLVFKKAASLSFDWKVSSEERYDGLLVENGDTTLYTYGTSGAEVTGCSGDKTGTATVYAQAGDTVSISYRKDSSTNGGSDCLWLKNFTYSEPNQVIFHANNGTESTVSQGIFDKANLLANSFTYEGYLFKGWATAANGTVAYTDGAEFTIEDTNVDLYAVWAPIYNLDFTVTPEKAVFALYTNEERSDEITPNTTPSANADYSYTLENGSYYWAASAFGYEAAKGTVTINGAAEQQEIALTAKALYTITFTYSGADASSIDNGSLVVKTGDQVMEPTSSGSLSYNLPVGYDYSYTFTSKNYARQSGTIALADTSETGAETVTIALTAKTAWEGADDILAVTPDSDNIYHITTGAELAWLAQEVNSGRLKNAHAVLDNDIDLGNEQWTPIGKNATYPFAGTFDGQGHKIANLKVEGSSYLGLFGYIGTGGEVTNITIENGSISGTDINVGGIAGYNSGIISKCVNKATVSSTKNNTSSSYGLVGGITAYCAGGASISNCANFGDISGTNGYGAGGIVGNAYGGYNNKAVITNVYNNGSIYAMNWSGGIIGISSYVELSNAYNRGSITASYTYVGELIGNRYSSNLTTSSLYYLNNTGNEAAGNTTVQATAIQDKEAMVAALAGKVGAFVADTTPNINDGWPILGFQDPTATYNLTLTVSPADATIVLTKDGESSALANPDADLASVPGAAVYTFEGLNGKYNYQISRDDYSGQTGSFNINGESLSKKIELIANEYKFSLTVSPIDAKVELKQGDTVLKNPTATDGVYTYSLPSGEYQLTISQFGKISQTETVIINKEDAAKTITLQEAASTQLTFAISYSDDPETPPAATITVKYGDSVIDAEDNGSYTLPSGVYSYTVKAKGYAKAEGQLTIPENPEAATTKKLTLDPTSAWDGETITEPDTGSGSQSEPYLIEDGEMLAWLAQEVNSGVNTSGKYYQLTGDIDLGDNPWTPIGKSYSYYFAGSFDGCGYTIKGLNVDSNSGYAGLFGYVKGSSSKYADIKNLTVIGSSTNSSGISNYTSGIVAYASYTNIINCHNQASVTVTGNTQYAGGVVGYLYNGGSLVGCSNSATISAPNSEYVGGVVGSANIFTSTTSIQQSYNCGSVTGKTKVGGIIGNLATAATDLYNTGTVSGSEAVGGIAGYQGANIANAYTTGKVSGTTEAYAAFGRISTYYSRTNIYYLDNLTMDDNATAISAADLIANGQNLLGENWLDNSKGTTNNKYPLLSWQTVIEEGASSGNKLDAPNINWQTNSTGNEERAIAEWAAVENATAYEVQLVVQKVIEDGNITTYEYETVVTRTVPATQSETTYTCDFSDVFESGKDSNDNDLPNGWYFVQAIAKAEPNSDYSDSDVSAMSWAFYQYLTTLDTPTGLTWKGPMAYWDNVDFAEAYLVAVYYLPEDETAEPVYIGSGMSYCNELDCSNIFSVGYRYVFNVQALGVIGEGGDAETIYSQISAYSHDESNGGTEYGIYQPGTTPEEPDEGDWITISTPEQLIDLADLEELTDNEKEERLSKNYKLANDLDFSTLSAEYAAKNKTIGVDLTLPFTGIFDGNGKTISGLTLSNGDAGLFAYIGAEGIVRNLTIEGANLLYADNAGVLVNRNRGTIKNCAIINCNITADTGSIIGGLCSRNQGVIEDCYVLGGSIVSNSTYARGIAGFVGANQSGGRINNCYSTISITTQGQQAGGFVGRCEGVSSISNCFALGNVTANSYCGGFAGQLTVNKGISFTSCYAANTVTATNSDDTACGFLGASDSSSSLAVDPAGETFTNCFYNTELTATDTSGASVEGKTTTELKAITATLGLNWTQDDSQNNGLPYLRSLPAPENVTTTEITVQLMTATYNPGSYDFSKYSGPIEITINSTGNTRVVDVMDAAVSQGLLSYGYKTTTAYGRYIQSINGYEVDPPDGWMFTINDQLANVSATLATVKDGDKILWYEGTTQNRFQGPTWDEILNGSVIQWIDIATAGDLIALTQPAANMSGNYRLTANINLENTTFSGIGSTTTPFSGVFDGQGYTISNLNMTGEENVGLFNVIEGATIKNINLDGVAISGSKNVGALVGLASASIDTADLSNNKANLLGNCHVNSGKVEGNSNVGGLVGNNMGTYDSKTGFSIYSSIDKCTATVTVTGLGNTTNNFATGGLVGDNSGYITECAANGTVSGHNMVGGLIGDSSGDIYDSYATGNVSGKGTVGGFAGSSSGKIKNCYSLGDVSGEERTGGFAGSLSAAEYVASAGQITVTGSSSIGYNGGFAGELNGTITGLESQITVKDAYANCIQDDSPIKAVGNSSKFTSDEAVNVLAGMQLTTKQAVAEKLYTMFGVNLPTDDSSLQEEADKYRDVLTVPYKTEINTELILLHSGQVANNDINLSISIKASDDPNEYLQAEGAVLKLAKIYGGSRTAAIPVTLCFTNDSGTYYKQVIIYLQEELPEIEELLPNIANRYVSSVEDYWYVVGIQAYGNPTYQYSEELIQNYIDVAIADIISTESQDTTIAMHIITLKALGYDAFDLVDASGTERDGYQYLQQAKNYSIDGKAYTLLAYLQNDHTAYANEINSLIAELEATQQDGHWGEDWGEYGAFYSDSTAVVLTSLALAQDKGYSVTKETIDNGFNYLKSQLLLDGSVASDHNGQIGNANTTAMVILAFKAYGIDPATISAVDGVPLSEGLLAYRTNDNNGFYYDDPDQVNDFATKQGFLALIALTQAEDYNIFDFSANSSHQAVASTQTATYTATFVIKDSEGNRVTKDASLTVRNGEGTKMRATESGVYELPAGSYSYNVKYADHLDKSGSFTISAADRTITIELELEGIEVSFRLIGDDKHGSSGHDSYLTWYATRDYLVAEDSTVWDLAVTAFDQAGLSYTWKKGYLSAVESPLTGIKLAEKDNGTASGWMYTVNGKSPNKGMGDYYLEEGDEVIVYFTDDYSTRYTGFSVRDADPSKATLKAALAVLIDEAEELLDNVAISADGADIAANQYWVDQQAYTALEKALATAEKAYKNAETFDDYQEAISDLAQAIEKFGEEMSYGLLAVTTHFSDVPTTHWAFEHIEYLYSQGLITGKTTTLFAPEAPITRAEVITILARMSGENLAGYNSGFSDVAANAYYAGAVTWGVRAGITNGTTATTFSPNEPITREQIAAMIYRYAEYRGYNFTYTQSAINFTDQSNISAYAFNAVYSMQRAGIIDGYANGAWLPQGYASRAEAAKMLALAQQMFSASASSYLYAA